MNTRQLAFEISLNTTPAEVWSELTEADRIPRWFAPEARVQPGVGGSIWLSWGGGMEGSQTIEVWEPGRHLRLRMGESSTDFFIEPAGERTLLRLVDSGCQEAEQANQEYDSASGGWTTFLKMLTRDLERHATEPAINFTLLRQVACSRDQAWQRLMKAPELKHAVPIPGHPEGYGGFAFPEWNDSYLALFCEGLQQTTVTTTWILYGFTAEWEQDVRTRWTAWMDQQFPPLTVSAGQ